MGLFIYYADFRTAHEAPSVDQCPLRLTLVPKHGRIKRTLAKRTKVIKETRREANRQRMVPDSRLHFPSLVSIPIAKCAFLFIDYIQLAI